MKQACLIAIALLGSLGCADKPCGEYVRQNEWKYYPPCPFNAICGDAQFVAMRDKLIIAYYNGKEWIGPDGKPFE